MPLCAVCLVGEGTWDAQEAPRSGAHQRGLTQQAAAPGQAPQRHVEVGAATAPAGDLGEGVGGEQFLGGRVGRAGRTQLKPRGPRGPESELLLWGPPEPTGPCEWGTEGQGCTTCAGVWDPGSFPSPARALLLPWSWGG